MVKVLLKVTEFPFRELICDGKGAKVVKHKVIYSVGIEIMEFATVLPFNDGPNLILVLQPKKVLLHNLEQHSRRRNALGCYRKRFPIRFNDISRTNGRHLSNDAKLGPPHFPL